MFAYRTSIYHNGEDTIQVEIVLRLTLGSVLRLTAALNSAIYSDAGGKQTSFIGMLLYKGWT